MRVNSKRWPFVKTAGSSSGDEATFYPLALTEQQVKDYFNRVREWQVHFTISQPLSPSGSNTADVTYTHRFQTTIQPHGVVNMWLNEKRRILAKNGITELGGTSAWPGEPTGVATSQFAICANTWESYTGIDGTLTNLAQLRVISGLFYPMIGFSLHLFAETEFDEFVSSWEKEVTDYCTFTGRTKHSFNGSFDGRLLPMWFASPATEPDPGPATWSVSIDPLVWFKYADKAGAEPIYDENDGTENLDPLSRPNPLA